MTTFTIHINKIKTHKWFIHLQRLLCISWMW